MLLTALFPDGDTEALMCLMMDKQKVHGEKTEPPVLVCTSVREATLSSTPKAVGIWKTHRRPYVPSSQRHINCSIWFRFTGVKGRKMMRLYYNLILLLPVKLVHLSDSSMLFLPVISAFQGRASGGRCHHCHRYSVMLQLSEITSHKLYITMPK